MFLIEGVVLAENSQNVILAFWVFCVNFLCVLQNAFLKMGKETLFECFEKLKIETG